MKALQNIINMAGTATDIKGREQIVSESCHTYHQAKACTGAHLKGDKSEKGRRQEREDKGRKERMRRRDGRMKANMIPRKS